MPVELLLAPIIVGSGWLPIVFVVSLLLTVLVMLAVATSAIQNLDQRALDVLSHRIQLRPDGKPKRLTTAPRDLTSLGGDTLRLLFLVACLAALACHNRWRVAGALISIFAVARLILLLMKALVRRPRPLAGDSTLVTYTSSFPSGHTFMAGVLYLSAAILIPSGSPSPFLPIAIGAALILSLSIGFTRVVFGIHWPSDVAAGWLASIAWTTGCVLFLVRAGLFNS